MGRRGRRKGSGGGAQGTLAPGPEEPAPSPPEGEGPGIRRGRLAADVTAALALGFFALLKAWALSPALSDENIYFYMCSRIAEGALPYRDFFFAHPPFHLVPGALLMSLVGFSLPAAKAVPAVAALLAGVAVYRAGRRAGAAQGVVALCIFLFAYDLLRASSHFTGASEATALLAWAVERALAGRPRAAGLLAASAGLTAFYAVPAGAALFVWLALRGRGEARSYALAWGSLFAGVNVACLAFFREGYWEPVFEYHFMKPPGGPGNLLSALRGLARENPWMIWSAPAALITLLASRPGGDRRRAREPLRSGVSEALRDPARGPALAGLMIAALHLGFFSLLTRVYTFYTLPAFPGLALAGGSAYLAALGRLAGSVTPGRTARERGRRRSAAAPIAAAVAVLAAPWILPALLPLRGVDADEGEVLRTYAWKEAPLPGWMNAAVRALLWSDERVQGSTSLAPTRYLWHESRHFTAPARLAERLRGLTAEGGTVYGDSIAAPLVALLAGRRIARDHVDTNSMRYRSGITPPGEAIADLETDPPAAVIASPRRGFFLVPEMRAWVNARYEVAARVQDPLYGPYELWLPKGR